jgi:hypothetical protein
MLVRILGMTLYPTPTLTRAHTPTQLEIAKGRRDDVTVQGSAYAALAAAHQKLGAVDDAVECLQKFLAVGQDTDNRKMQVRACLCMCVLCVGVVLVCGCGCGCS